jgi:hypothetical protein
MMVEARVEPPASAADGVIPVAAPVNGDALAGPDVGRLVTSTMQRTLTGLGNKRRFPVIG